MKSNLIVIVIISFSILSCENKNRRVTTGNEDETKKSDSKLPVDCYWYAEKNDTILLTLMHTGGEAITGTLLYKLYEKDKNLGTIRGTLKDGLLLADYTFMSEGVQSVRQVAFKKEDGVFVEGNGEIVSTTNGAFFKNPRSLEFNPNVSLTEIDCQ